MPHSNAHVSVGGISGGAYAAHAWGLPVPPLFAAAVRGVAGGIGYLLNEQLPEWQKGLRNQGLHYARSRAAPPSLLARIGYGILEFLCYFLSGALSGLLSGYASHLSLDSLTPSSFPILC